MTTDTSLRRRARELLAAEYEREGIIGGVREGASHIDRAAVRAIEAALSHPQPDTPAQSQQESTNQKWIDRAEAKLAAQQAVAVPEGFVLVPAEPTREMVEAGILFGNSPNKAAIIYQNMLSAAPTPQKGVSDG